MIHDTYVADRCSEIDATIQYAANKSANDPDLGGHLAGYISVIITGVVEDSIEHFVVQRASKAQDPHLLEYVKRSIAQQFRNPQSRAISDLLERFSADYRSAYQSGVSQQAKEALGSLVTNRISLTHQGTLQSNLTINDVQNYFSEVKAILEKVEQILL